MGKAKDDFTRAAAGRSGTGKRRRSGSETRKRGKPRSIRFTPEEDQRIAEMEEATGLAFAAMVRHALFNTPLPRGTRKPSVEVKAIAQLLGQLGKIGGNVNQIAKRANMERPELNIPELAMALRDLGELRIACLQAIGYERDHGDHAP